MKLSKGVIRRSYYKKGLGIEKITKKVVKESYQQIEEMKRVIKNQKKFIQKRR